MALGTSMDAIAKRSPTCSIGSVFKACFSSGSRYDEYWEGSGSGRRIFASDEDRGRWVAEPGIDKRASDFIARYYASRVTDSGERQFAS